MCPRRSVKWLPSHIGSNRNADSTKIKYYLQVLRTLQTLIQRGIVEVRAGAPPPVPESDLLRPSQVQRLREWVQPGSPGGPARDAKVVLAGPEPSAVAAALQASAQLQ